MKYFVPAALFIALALLPHATMISLAIVLTRNASVLDIDAQQPALFAMIGGLALISIADEFRKRDKRGELAPLAMPDRRLLFWTAKATAYGLVPVSILSVIVGVASCGYPPHQFECAMACIGLFVLNVFVVVVVSRALGIRVPWAPLPLPKGEGGFAQSSLRLPTV